MRLVEVKITNFRGYAQETTIKLDPLTLLIGRNDAGKSSVLDALDIFFNESDIEKSDCCVRTGSSDITIACVFDELPAQLVIDDAHPTTLQSEHLLRTDGMLEIIKNFNCQSAKGKVSGIFAKAHHPTERGLGDLLGLKISELKKRAQDQQVNLSGVNQTIKAELRQAIWAHAPTLTLADTEVALNKEAGKEVWEQLVKHLPVFAVFKSDRASTDQDAEAQDPMKAAIKQALQSRTAELGHVISDVVLELEKVAAKTVEKIREMNPDLANQLNPQVKNKNWDSLFSVSLTGDEDIPINKRGSGTRRLVLLNFFRAMAEDTSMSRGTGVIYAIEEPETSQHPNHQIMLLEVFQELVAQGRCQILLTTHTPTLARRVDRNALRLINLQNGVPTVHYGNVEATLELIKLTLGVLPDHDVKVFFGVEGKNDIDFLKRISAILSTNEQDIPDLAEAERTGKLIFIPLGGSSLELWVSRLAGLDRPEFYLTDRDQPPPQQPKYHRYIVDWRTRGCTAWATSKRELENYLHPSAISAALPGCVLGVGNFDDVPLLFAEFVHTSDPNAPPWSGVDPETKKKKVTKAKRRLNTECVERMTAALLDASDPQNELRSWLRLVGAALRR